jgi:hypothetical protein
VARLGFLDIPIFLDLTEGSFPGERAGIGEYWRNRPTWHMGMAIAKTPAGRCQSSRNTLGATNNKKGDLTQEG